MTRRTTYIDSAGGLKQLGRSLAGDADLAVDCEAAGYHRYSDRLCLVQLSTPSETFVLDPLAVPLTASLKPFLEEPARRALMHGGSYDLRLLRRDLDIAVARLFDTQVAAGFLGEPAIGLQALLEKHLGIRVAKKFQRADWARRPLSREMISYAAGDTRYLHRLTAVLEARLRDLGRLEWAQEECRRLVDTTGKSGEEEPPPDPVTRVKGARRLGPRAVTALREAIGWRDGIARSRDRAPFRVASDAALLETVLTRPGSVEELIRVKGFPRRLAATDGRALLRALRRVRRLAAHDLQPYPVSKRGRGRPSPEEEAAFDRLNAVRNEVAAKLGLERGRVMANHLLREVVAARPSGLAQLGKVPDVRRWQVEVLGAELLEAL
ncbi:MAG: HRDC domain-containing protein [Gemmatimonadota bacterium]|nr:HRDC domain-containing protein [Gemmatimonadota bacterium]MDE2871244.1 HRDC domain-containing protein [Gemmatimonadota bacterium]